MWAHNLGWANPTKGNNVYSMLERKTFLTLSPNGYGSESRYSAHHWGSFHKHSPRRWQSTETERIWVLDAFIGPLITVPGACFASGLPVMWDMSHCLSQLESRLSVTCSQRHPNQCTSPPTHIPSPISTSFQNMCSLWNWNFFTDLIKWYRKTWISYWSLLPLEESTVSDMPAPAPL